MGVQDVSISQNSSYRSLSITHLTAITQYKWDYSNPKQLQICNCFFCYVVVLFFTSPLLIWQKYANFVHNIKMNPNLSRELTYPSNPYYEYLEEAWQKIKN